ncbi:MAG: endonuclease Q family protein [Candidatus Hermodarchaeota archaeon]
MDKICDLHIHSKFSGGASKNIDVFKIAYNCNLKGIQLVGTGDCLHPLWLIELKNNLIEHSDGVFYIPKVPNVNFILQTEIEVIWNNHLNTKKVHFIILFPNFEKLDEAIKYLSKFGNLTNEGRPRIYNSPEIIIYGLKLIDENIEIIPAHIFTPYFGIFGDKTHFNTMKEALGVSFNYINCIETGLSADPIMVRSISELNKVSIISNSDCHSTNFHRLGREATKIQLNKLTYHDLVDSIKRNKIIKTYEFKPSQGKYYYDGHKPERHFNKKDYYCSPKLNIDICPYCNKSLTKGVLSRVQDLSDQISPFKLNFQYIVPLLHLISVVLGGSEYDRRNLSIYQMLIENNDNEFAIWEGKSNFDNIPENLNEAINKIRNGKFWFIPGHDAVYGKLQFEN